MSDRDWFEQEEFGDPIGFSLDLAFAPPDFDVTDTSRPFPGTPQHLRAGQLVLDKAMADPGIRFSPHKPPEAFQRIEGDRIMEIRAAVYDAAQGARTPPSHS